MPWKMGEFLQTCFLITNLQNIRSHGADLALVVGIGDLGIIFQIIIRRYVLKIKKNQSMNEVPPAVGTISIARIVDKKRREGEQVSAIEQYKIAHFSAKKNRIVNEKANEIWNELLSEEAAFSCSPAEICFKKLHRIPVKGRAASTKQVLATIKSEDGV